MMATKDKILDNVELVKSIEDRTSSMYSYFHKVERPSGTTATIKWHKYKQN